MIQPPLGLLTHLVALRWTLREQSAGQASTQVDLDSPPHLKLELLPYAVSEMWHAFTSLVRAAHSIAVELGEDIPLLPECFFLSDSDRDLLAYSIDAFMNAGARAQDAVLPYVQSDLKTSLPHSFRRVATQLSKYRALEHFVPLIESYWQTSGQRLRAYRVLMEHHTLVASEAFLARSDTGAVVLHILLPTNPDVESPAKLIYGNPPEHALLFMEQAFTALVRFAESITRPLLPRSSRRQAYLIAANRIAPITTLKVFHPIPSIEELSARVKQSVQASAYNPPEGS